MASDLKIEIFAFNTFHNLWYTYGLTETLPDVLEVYEDECNKVKDFMEALNIEFDPVIFVRRSLFQNVYRKVLNDEFIERLKAPFDCYHYVFSVCDNKELFGHLTVFQRVFATITFVLSLCLRMYDIGNGIDIVKYGHLFWLMHFDKYTEEFYEKGGWKMLQIETKPYKHLLAFEYAFSKCIFYMQKIKQATVNFFLSKDAVQREERKQKLPACFSKLWIKFRIEDFVNYVKIPLSYEFYVNSLEAELLLQDLELILVPSRPTSGDSRTANPTAILLSEISSVTKEIQANYERVQAITYEQSKLIDRFLDNYSSIESGFEKKTNTECVLCQQEQLNLAITDKERNFEFEKISLTEKESSQKTNGVDSAKTLNTEQDIFQVVYEKEKSVTSDNDSTNAGDLYRIVESKIIDRFLDKFSSIESGFEKKTNTECVHCQQEQLNLAITDQERNFEFEKISLTEIESSQKTNGVDSAKTLNTEQDIFQDVYEKEKSVTSDNDSTNAGDLYRICGSEPFIKKCESGKTENDCKVNIKRQDSIGVAGQAVFRNEMVEIVLPERISSRTISCPVSKYSSSDDKRKQTIKAQEDFRNERTNPVMKHFLKMILVLGDMEAAKSVLSKFQIKERGMENSQESSKKKKKNKKKSGK